MTLSAIANDIRALGWMLAVHNDYVLREQARTFWLFTKKGQAVKGEGLSDTEALNTVRAQIGQNLQHGKADPASVPDDLRARGWATTIHNDFKLDGVFGTYWVMTRDGRTVVGEGATDAIALDQIRARAMPIENDNPNPEITA